MPTATNVTVSFYLFDTAGSRLYSASGLGTNIEGLFRDAFSAYKRDAAQRVASTKVEKTQNE